MKTSGVIEEEDRYRRIKRPERYSSVSNAGAAASSESITALSQGESGVVSRFD